MASITESREIGKLLVAIDHYDSFPVIRYALPLAPLVFPQPGELRKGELKKSTLTKPNGTSRPTG
jgi:hypothetical protein